MRNCPVTVIIPTYNRGMLVERAIVSVFKQKIHCSELIIIDDGSTDQTQEILRTLAPPENVLFRVFHQENKGPSSARNLGILKSNFPYIAFLDSDDHWHKNKLAVQYSSLVANAEYQISHTYEKWLRRGFHLNQKKKHIPQHGDIFQHCLELCAVGMSTVMVKKELFEKVGYFDETLPCCEDYDLWLRTSCNHRFLLIDQPLTIKEGGREDQVSSQYRLGMDKMRIYSLRKLLDSGNLDCHQHFLALKELRRKLTVYGKGCLKHKKVLLGQSYLDLIDVYEKKALAKFPLSGDLA